VIYNAHGAGVPHCGGIVYWYDRECPIHTPPSRRPPVTADAIARVLAEQGKSVVVYGNMLQEQIKLPDILAADRLAQRERHAALAREIGRGHGLGEAIARAILGGADG
jgi:hypothetical protein